MDERDFKGRVNSVGFLISGSVSVSHTGVVRADGRAPGFGQILRPAALRRGDAPVSGPLPASEASPAAAWEISVHLKQLLLSKPWAGYLRQHGVLACAHTGLCAFLLRVSGCR